MGLPKAIKRRDLIKRFKQLNWTGPHQGHSRGRHPEYMEKDGRVVHLPNVHSKRSDIGPGLLKDILNQAGVSADEWLGKEEQHEEEETTNDGDNDRSHKHV